MGTTVKELMEVGAHFGHQSSQRHPAFEPFVYEERRGVHIINTALTLMQLEDSAEFLKEIAANNGRILFVATKPKVSNVVKEQAERAGQFYVTFRWLGGFLTNFKTIRNSIKKMISYEENSGRADGLAITKKERLMMRVENEKLVRVLSGVRDMRKAPEAVVIVDTGLEQIAVHECNILGIPVVGICDSNSDPTQITNPIPANDDSVRAVELYMKVLADAILEGQSLAKEKANQVEDSVEETEFVLDKEEDMDEAALLARRKVYKVKKTVTMKEEAPAEESSEETAESTESAEGEEAPAEAGEE